MSEVFKPSPDFIEAIYDVKTQINPLLIQEGRVDDFAALQLLLCHTVNLENIDHTEYLISPRKRFVEQYSLKQKLGRDGFLFLISKVRKIANISLEQTVSQYSPSLWRDGRKCLRSCRDGLRKGEAMSPERQEYIQKHLPPFLTVLEAEVETLL